MLTSLRDTLFVWLQYLLPQHLISRLIHRLTRLRIRWLKNALIRWFIGHFRVDMQEALEEDYRAYPDFNHFFTRALKPDARPLAAEPDAVLSPVDGTVSQAGHIEGEAIFQAKGHRYSLATLLGHSAPWQAAFGNGEFTTLYLSPRDYHRIHMPRRGVLREMIHIPGRLFSVNPITTRRVPGLFARNERVVCLFDTDAGPMALVLVGAINVGSIETVWAGEITPPAGRRVRRWRYDDRHIELAAGAEMGRFNMGSTVILLFGEGRVAWEDGLRPEATVRMGQKIGRVLAMDDRG
jgi:phosphatidylserine decarboxylase